MTTDLKEPAMGAGAVVHYPVHFEREAKGRRVLQAGARPKVESRTAAIGRVPRLARLMALALHFDGLVRAGEVKDHAELARLGRVTRARMCQVMALLNLAPDLQEALLFLPSVYKGRDPVTERDVRPIALLVEWAEQRRRWKKLTEDLAGSGE